jgi:hypothetical protein
MDAIETVPDQSNVTAGSHITDPFAVVTEGNNPAKDTLVATASQDQPPNAPVTPGLQASEGGNVHTSASSLSALDAAASPAQQGRRILPHNDTAVNKRNEFDSLVDTDAHAGNQLTMPQRVNLHKADLR